jgi:hypothetical protein
MSPFRARNGSMTPHDKDRKKKNIAVLSDKPARDLY